MSLPLSYLDLPDIDDVEAIRISSAGEVSAFGLPKISAIEIKSTDPVFTPSRWQVSKISQLIGIPIAGRKLILEHEQPESLNVSNSEATMLFQNIDILAPEKCDDLDTGPEGDEKRLSLPGSLRSLRPFEGFGWAPEYWQFSVGPVIIARLDKKTLHPLHASALIKFCQGNICTKVEEMHETLANEQTFLSWAKRTSLEKRQRVRELRQGVIDECSREKFERYFKTYKWKRVSGVRMSRFDLSFEAWDVPEWEKDAKPEWQNVGSPYEV